MTLLLDPWSPNIHLQILQTGLYTFPVRISSENLIKDQSIFSFVSIVLTLITFSLANVWMSLGENWCWSLLGLKGSHSFMANKCVRYRENSKSQGWDMKSVCTFFVFLLYLWSHFHIYFKKEITFLIFVFYSIGWSVRNCWIWLNCTTLILAISKRLLICDKNAWFWVNQHFNFWCIRQNVCFFVLLFTRLSSSLKEDLVICRVFWHADYFRE